MTKITTGQLSQESGISTNTIDTVLEAAEALGFALTPIKVIQASELKVGEAETETVSEEDEG